uniref:Uncharacterized protein n=1 Tax=Pyxicephalus adspersus TaxID=30357 RepID=A0AAV2ZEN5_PYXAD|nr:TPA: hypothetical protein GDO54_005474 [Pyxicephalus adspersus]
MAHPLVIALGNVQQHVHAQHHTGLYVHLQPVMPMELVMPMSMAENTGSSTYRHAILQAPPTEADSGQEATWHDSKHICKATMTKHQKGAQTVPIHRPQSTSTPAG